MENQTLMASLYLGGMEMFFYKNENKTKKMGVRWALVCDGDIAS